MKLDRNVNGNGRGKYALLKLRKLNDFADASDPFQDIDPPIADAIKTLDAAGLIDWGIQGSESEFFVIRLKDKFSSGALEAYASAAMNDGETEYAHDVFDMARRSGHNNRWCQKPD